MKKIFLRADGSAHIGLGHVMRLLAVADMLKQSYDLTFVIQQTEPAIIGLIKAQIAQVLILPSSDIGAAFFNILAPGSLVFLDGYTFPAGYQKAIKDTGAKLVCIDDLFDRHFYADAVINHAGTGMEAMYSKEEYTRLFLGSDYALLRRPFLDAAVLDRRIDTIDTAFVNMGGSDEYNITEKVVSLLYDLDWVKNINIVVGASYIHLETLQHFTKNKKNTTIHHNIDAQKMCDVMMGSHLAICPASTVSFEVCAVGLYCISGYTADNQKYILGDMVNREVVKSIGNFFTLDRDKFLKTAMLVQDGFANKQMLINQKKYVDGHSALRIIKIIESIETRNITL
jgi:UDP-2,4-diacetamido-2,4,6-trideoxy-beta-L-altropyranose hydrolase